MAVLPPSSDSLQSNSSSHKQIQTGPADHQGLAEQRGEEEMGPRLVLPQFLFTAFSSRSWIPHSFWGLGRGQRRWGGFEKDFLKKSQQKHNTGHGASRQQRQINSHIWCMCSSGAEWNLFRQQATSDMQLTLGHCCPAVGILRFNCTCCSVFHISGPLPSI